MSEDTAHQIEQRLAELPEDVHDAVLSAEMGEHVRAIGQKHGLHIDQIGKLEDETMLVMLGFFEPSKFNEQIEQQLLIPAADASALAAEISEQVFEPIRHSLEGFMQKKRSDADVRMPSSVQATETAPTPIAITKVAPPTQAPVIPVVPPTPTPIAPTTPAMPTAEKMLTEKTTNLKPIYKTDPYREPIE